MSTGLLEAYVFDRAFSAIDVVEEVSE